MNLLYYLDRTLHKIIICTKAPEDLYDYLIKKIDDVEIHYEGFIPEFQKMNKGENALIIFDDLVLDKNTQIAEMFIRGRKLGYSLIFISQSYYSINPKIIRQNVNYIFLGRGLHKRDLNTILGEFAMGLEKEELEKLYSSLTREQMNFMFIDFLKRNIRHNITDIILEF
jgi:hypothetical protein